MGKSVVNCQHPSQMLCQHTWRLLSKVNERALFFRGFAQLLRNFRPGKI